MQDIISMNNIIKVFPPNVIALNDVSINFREGEIHAVVGENGAGKSTLMKILYGMQPANAGEITQRGNRVHFNTPADATAHGIGMVHQEILLVPEYTIWENIILGYEPVTFLGQIDRKKAKALVREKIDAFQFKLDPEAKVADISVAARQKVEILKLLYRNVSFLIFDEPTSVLTPQEIPQLFTELRNLRANGCTIVYISHHLDEVLDLSDRTTVLRKGEKVATIDTKDLSMRSLAQLMVGREVIFDPVRKPQNTGGTMFELSGINIVQHNKPMLEAVNIRVQAGEIVGVAGVEGNGQQELVKAIMGLIPVDQGKIVVNGMDLTQASILERRKSIAFVSQDRASAGTSLTSSIKENAIMTHHRLNPALTRYHGIVQDQSAIDKFTAAIRQNFDIHMDNPEAEIRSLSGGNQQKVILGRELKLGTPFLLLDQPSRGLDVGSIEYIHRQILQMRDEGHAILLLSSDLEELFRISDRIIVLHRGRIVATLETENTTPEEVGILMLEGDPLNAKTHH